MNNKTNIEEDIEILNAIVKVNNDFLKNVENQTINQREIQAIENILADRERLKEENKQFINAEVMSVKQIKLIEEQIKKYFIHKNKVQQLQDKANKYDALVEKIIEKLRYKKQKIENLQDDRYRKMCLQVEIDVLHELIDTEEE